MLDPIVLAVLIGVVASVTAGSVSVYGMQFIPQRWRKATQWFLICGAAAVAIAVDLLSEGPGGEGVFVFIVAALPGYVAYLASSESRRCIPSNTTPSTRLPEPSWDSRRMPYSCTAIRAKPFHRSTGGWRRSAHSGFSWCGSLAALVWMLYWMKIEIR